MDQTASSRYVILSNVDAGWILTTLSRKTALKDLSLTAEEHQYLKDKCPYLPEKYLQFLQAFRFKPDEQVEVKFTQATDLSERAKWEELCQVESNEEFGDVTINVKGKWLDTILYEIPLLVLVSECYFKFANTDWDYDGQEVNA